MSNSITQDERQLLRKLQRVKKNLHETDIKMTGYNKFKNYKYFELKDIEYPILRALEMEDLASKFAFHDGMGYLLIYDLETGAKSRWETPIGKPVESGRYIDCMQAEQGKQTFARRTLYLQALSLADTNTIDMGIEEEDKKVNNKVPKKESKLKQVSENKPKSNNVSEIKSKSNNVPEKEDLKVKNPIVTPKKHVDFVKKQLSDRDEEVNNENIVKFLNRELCDFKIDNKYRQYCFRVLGLDENGNPKESEA